jgi:hypothetical protein
MHLVGERFFGLAEHLTAVVPFHSVWACDILLRYVRPRFEELETRNSKLETQDPRPKTQDLTPKT